MSEEVTRPSLKKAEDLIVHFAPKVKLQFDDIFVSTISRCIDMRLSAQYCVALFLPQRVTRKYEGP